jgi:hypothetical protein
MVLSEYVTVIHYVITFFMPAISISFGATSRRLLFLALIDDAVSSYSFIASNDGMNWKGFGRTATSGVEPSVQVSHFSL